MPRVNVTDICQTKPVKQCQRCGSVWLVLSTRKISDLCASCRARKTTKVNDCLIWQGNYAEDLVTPINDEGQLVVTGSPSCGHSDCVSPEHRKGN